MEGIIVLILVLALPLLAYAKLKARRKREMQLYGLPSPRAALQPPNSRPVVTSSGATLFVREEVEKASLLWDEKLS